MWWNEDFHMQNRENMKNEGTDLQNSNRRNPNHSNQKKNEKHVSPYSERGWQGTDLGTAPGWQTAD